MVERGGRRHPWRRWIVPGGIVAAALLVALAASSGGSGGDAEAACRRAAPPAETALMPAGLSFARVGTVTRVRKDDHHLVVKAVSAKPIDELTVLIQDAVTAAGYRPAGMDNEGFEAEVFFTAGMYAAGQAVIRRADCANRWEIDLVLIDRGSGR